jgi:uncharacterized membrane protein YphA (DoxX/SURF4 family)
MTKQQTYVSLFLRIALSVTLLSAVADRFGYWGTQSVWGNWQNFVQYTGKLIYYLPAVLTEPAAITVTVAECIFAILLLIGYKTKITAYLTGTLILLFALSMAAAVGIKSTLDYSVWVTSAASFLLTVQNHYPFSIDKLLKKHDRVYMR